MTRFPVDPSEDSQHHSPYAPKETTVTQSDQIVQIPEGFVPTDYLNDPETETVIWGDSLVEGMVILAEDAGMRHEWSGDRIEEMHPLTRKRYLESARWCRVTELRHDRIYDQSVVNPGITRFLAVYADGSVASRSYNVCHAWIVKRASMPGAAA